MAADKTVKVYGWAVAPVVARALLALEEAGVGYELVAMSRDAGDHRRPDHLARNRFGKVAVLEDGELMLFESRAISRYVLRKYKRGGGADLLREGNLEEAAMVDAWLEAEAHQYHPAISHIVRPCVILPMVGGARHQRVVDEHAGKLREVLGVLADIAHFGFTHYLMRTEYAALMEERANV
ncbi:hypothetical protein GQ55_3G112300 [Panicum hallii var. hallii]|uniref:glutathione transferase n=1 Tax=Panicum hallii var. hallii TaxID=1504633 RepID=A0A2T7E887_9POAL|nr:hypothetical protein GQ55_3G112300 [Panicum hallii var. hallii]